MPPVSAMSDRYGLPIEKHRGAFEDIIRNIERENVLIQFSWTAYVIGHCSLGHCSLASSSFVDRASKKSVIGPAGHVAVRIRHR